MTLSEGKRPVEWLSESVESERVMLRIGWDGERLVAEWPGAVRLMAREDGSDVSLEIAQGLHSDFVDKLQHGVVPAFIRHLTGQMSLHCSAVATESGAVLLVGESGSGKSTLCAYLCLRSRAKMLADDIAHLEVDKSILRVLPSETNHWLLSDARRALGVESKDERSKAPTTTKGGAAEPAQLMAIVFLGWNDSEPTITRMRSAKSIVALSHSLARFNLRSQDVMRQDFERLGDLCTKVECYCLSRPRDFSKLNASADILLKTMGELHGKATEHR